MKGLQLFLVLFVLSFPDGRCSSSSQELARFQANRAIRLGVAKAMKQLVTIVDFVVMAQKDFPVPLLEFFSKAFCSLGKIDKNLSDALEGDGDELDADDVYDKLKGAMSPFFVKHFADKVMHGFKKMNDLPTIVESVVKEGLTSMVKTLNDIAAIVMSMAKVPSEKGEELAREMLGSSGGGTVTGALEGNIEGVRPVIRLSSDSAWNLFHY